ncbi:MAG: MATE family efflux transporter [Lachnospiraceae bacterium]|nr:MATE family efflux transporter [Lachnospiraceae bacterium]
MTTNANLMTEGSIPKKIIIFAFPVFIGNLFQQLYNTADSLIVGNFIGSSALAAVSSAGNLIFLITGFFIGLSMGAGVVISTYIGAKKVEYVKKAVHTAVALGIVSSILMTFIGTVFAPQALLLMGTPANVLPESTTYFRIYFAGASGMVLYNTFTSILQASGDSKHPLFYLICSSLINITLDIVLIGIFHFGVGAAALATTISQFTSAILAFIKLVTVNDDIRLIPKEIRFHKFILIRILKVGLPSAFQNSIIGFANVVVQSYINYFQKAAIAGIGAYTKIEGFVFIPITSFAMALTTFIGQNNGAKKTDRVKKGFLFGMICSITLAELIGLIIFIFAPKLIAGFDPSEDVVFFGVQRARICAFFFCFLAYSHIVASYFRGLGKTIVPMLVMLICWCVIRVSILAITSSIHRTILITHWVYPITWVLSTIVYTYMLYRQIHIKEKSPKPM